jgi:hypothetical protein
MIGKDQKRVTPRFNGLVKYFGGEQDHQDHQEAPRRRRAGAISNFNKTTR